VYDVPGFKLGKYHHRDERVDPDDWNREPEPEDERLLRDFTERYFPDAAGPTMRLATCMFTNTPDKHFVLDSLPDAPQVVVGAGFSGHGFKFASVIGEILADLAVDGRTDHPIDMFRLDRFD
jgi:sarcosine oxidase